MKQRGAPPKDNPSPSGNPAPHDCSYQLTHASSLAAGWLAGCVTLSTQGDGRRYDARDARHAGHDAVANIGFVRDKRARGVDALSALGYVHEPSGGHTSSHMHRQDPDVADSARRTARILSGISPAHVADVSERRSVDIGRSTGGSAICDWLIAEFRDEIAACIVYLEPLPRRGCHSVSLDLVVCRSRRRLIHNLAERIR